MKRIANLDGLRGIAVLIVFLSHTSGRGMALAPWLDFQGIGHIGVYLFFVLSGFLLTRNLIEGQSAGAFFIRRFFRIAPLYFLVLAGVLIFGNDPMYLHVDGAIAHFLFLKGDGVFWSVAAEFGFYLLLPLIVNFIRRFGVVWVGAFTIAYFLWSLGAQFRGWLPLKFVDIGHSSQYLDVFLCGVLAAYVRRELLPKAVAAAFWGLLLLTLILVSKTVYGGTSRIFQLALVVAVIRHRICGRHGILRPREQIHPRRQPFVGLCWRRRLWLVSASLGRVPGNQQNGGSASAEVFSGFRSLCSGVMDCVPLH